MDMARMPLAGAVRAETCAAFRLVAKGRESAAAILQAALGEQLHATTSTTTHPGGAVRDLADQILRCFDRALAALRGGASGATECAAAGKRKAEHRPGPATTPVMSSKRIRASGGEETGIRVEKKCSTTTEDGFMWRKYGQKDIRGSRSPRVYLRCTYRQDRSCMAKRQVQQSEADPSRYVITYFGEHTCGRDGGAVDDDDGGLEESQAVAFVISFGSGGADRQRGGGGDGIAGEAARAWSLQPKREDQQAAECSKLGSTPVPDLEHFDGSLDPELGESSSFDIGEFISFDDLDLFL